MKKIVLLLLCLLPGFAHAQTQFWSDTFEDVGAPSSGTRAPSSSFYASNERYFDRVTTAQVNTTNTYSGFQGSKFWGGADIDNLTGQNTQSPHQNVTWSSINISGLSSITFRGLFAIGNSSNFDHFPGSSPIDYMIVEYRIDGGPWTSTLRFFPNLANNGAGALALETTGDSLAQGEGTALNGTFTEFIGTIVGTGTLLDLRFKCQANGTSFEEVAGDNFRLFHTPACTNPTISTHPSNSSVCNLGNTSFTIASSGATTWQWQVNCGSGFTNVTNGGVYAGATTQTLTITGATTGMNGCLYRCIATSGACNTTSNQATLSVSNPVLLANSQVNVACNGGATGSATVSPASGGIAPYTYNWTPGNPSGDGTISVSGLTAGTWTCTVTDNIGCSAAQTFTITQPAAIVLTAASQTNVSCFGGTNGAASVNAATGGAGGYTYNWTPGNPTGDGTVSVTGLTAGTWTCTVTDANSCTATRTFNITSPTALVVTPASQTNVSCFGGANGAASINTPTGGAGGYTYNWTPGNPTGDGTASVTGLIAGSWTCTVTDANSCTATQTFNITAPTAIVVTPASQTNVSCFGGANGAASINTPTGGAGGYTYNWTPGNPTGDGTVSVTGLIAGTWTCTVTDANTCTATRTFNITQPPAIVVTPASQTNISCNGGNNGAASINTPTGGAGGYTYNWTPGNPTGDGTVSVTGLTAGSWTCTVTDANSCTNTATFNITAPTAITANISSTSTSCTANTGTATVSSVTGGAGGYTYSWAPTGGTASTATGLAASTYTCTITDANTCNITRTVVVATSSGPSLTAASQTNVACFGGSTGAAAVNAATGGTAPYTYNWTPGNPTGDGTVSVTGLIAGTWTCTVTDNNGCTASVTFNVTSPSAIVLNANSQTNVSCFGGNNGAASVIAATGGAGGFTYNWTPGNPTGDGTVSVTGLTAGTWTCTSTDANGCTATRTFNITSPSAIVVTPASQTNISCNGGSNGAAAINTPTGGASGYTYNWTPGNPSGDGTVSVTGLTAGTWTCTVTDANSCTATATFNITAPTAINASISSTPTSCSANTGTATVSGVSGGAGGYTYSWAPTGGTAATATGLAAGTYTCTITDANACTLTRTVTVGGVAAPTLTALSQTNVSCFGGSNGAASVNAATGGSSPYTYNWTPGNPTGDGTTSVTGLTAGSWTCTVTDNNGCTATVSFNITSPSAIALTATATPTVICAGQSAVIAASATGGSGSFSYVWTPGSLNGSSHTVTPSTTTTYTVVTTDVNTCTASTVLTVSVNPLPSVTLSGTNHFCPGGSSLLTGTSGGTSQWYLNGVAIVGANTNTYLATTAGVYNMRKTNTNGCGDSAAVGITVTIDTPPAIASVTSSAVLCFGDSNGSATVSATGTPSLSYSWAPTGGTSTTASGLAAGNYTVTVTDGNTCTSSATVAVTSPTVLSTIPSQINATCFGGNDASASVAVSGGTAMYTYLWTPVLPPSPSANSLTAGAYSCLVTDMNGCTSTATFNITEPALITSSQSVTICNGDSLVVGTSVYSTAGTYIDTLTSTLGCDSIVTTALAVNPVPSVISVTSAAVCDSGSVTLGAAASGGANLIWYSDSALTVNVSSGNTYTTPLLFTTTTYYVQADSAGCYSAVVPVTVTVSTGAVTINQSLTLCFGDSVTIGSNTYYASGVYADTINFGGCDSIFNSTITVLNQITASQTLSICSGQSVMVGANTYTVTGIYMDTLTAISGCDSLVTTDLTVTLPDSSAQAVTVCNGGSYSIGANTYTASGVYADTLSNINGCDSVVTTTLTVLPANIVNQNITLCAGDSISVGNSVYYTAGTYADTIADINGCDSIINTVVNINTVDVSVTVTGFGGTLMSNASGPNTSWLWLNCEDNTAIISATMQSYSPNANGQFAVIVTQNGCTDTSTCFNVNTVGIDEQNQNSFGMYPNPAADNITIESNIGSAIVIFDAIGNQVFAANATNTKTEIELSNLANGIYFVKVISNNNEATQKLIISK